MNRERERKGYRTYEWRERKGGREQTVNKQWRARQKTGPDTEQMRREKERNFGYVRG